MTRYFALGLLLTLPFGLVQAQETTQPEAPFFEYPTELRHAYAIDLLSLHLDILGLDMSEEEEDAEAPEAEGAESEEGEEEEEGLVETAMPLLSGSLGATDADLLSALTEAFEATETGGPETAAPARDALGEVEAALIPAELMGELPFRAARLALLASLEPGVGEGYEEAAQGETDAYIVGYTGLQHIKGEWAELAPELDGDASNIERAFGVLDGLLPSPELPERFSDPEDAEVAVNDVIFGLESLTQTTLIPLRDFAETLSAIGTHVDESCAAAEAGDSVLALEWASAANFFYGAYLSDTLGIMAAEPNTQISEELGDLAEDPASADTPERCEAIGAAIEEASSVFGG